MIISHRHKFIFVKTLKTAGTSVETFLASYCGEDDIVTPIDVHDEMIRRKLGIYPKNCFRSGDFVIQEEKDLNITSPEELKKFRKQNRYTPSRKSSDKSRLLWSNHTRAKKMKRLIDEGSWNNYYKFCFDRNSWDRTLSEYYFARKNRNIEFATNEQVYDFVKKGLDKKRGFCNSSFYTNPKGKVILDDVFDYEHLDDAVMQICNKFGFDFEKFKSMPKFKTTTRIDRRPYDEFLTQQTIDFIADVHQKAIEIMNFKARPSKVQEWQ